MPITVTMLQTRQGEGGSLWTVGNSYSASDAFGTYLITSNLATGTIPAVPPTGISPAAAVAVNALVSSAGIPGATAASPLGMQVTRLNAALSKCWQGRVKSAASGAITSTRVCTVLEAHTDRVRIGIINGLAATMTGIKVSVATAPTMPAASASLATPAAGGSGWVAANLVDAAGASTSDVVAAGVDLNEVAITWTDWVACSTVARDDGGTLPVFFVTIQADATSANLCKWSATTREGWEDEGSSTTAPYGRPFKVRQQAVSAVTTPTSINSTTITEDCIPFIIQYVPRGTEGYTVMAGGDSILEGAGTGLAIVGHGSVEYARAQVSTMRRPVEICCMAIGSANAAQYTSRLKVAVPQIKPELLYLSLTCPNNVAPSTLTASNITAMNASIGLARTYAGAVGTRVLGMAGIPMLRDDADPAGVGSGEAYTTGYALWTANSAANLLGTLPIVNTLTPMSGVTDSNGQVRFPIGYSADGLHPSETGYQAMATALQPALASVYW
jgi:hypothetical protein